MSKKNKDIGLVVATKEEAYWINVKEKCEQEVFTFENALKFQKAVLVMVENKLALERAINPRRKK